MAMDPAAEERLKQILEHIQHESDPKKVDELVHELNELLQKWDKGSKHDWPSKKSVSA